MSTFSSILGIALQAIGDNNNAWGTILNESALVPLERAIAGNISHAVTGGTLDLSSSPPPSGVTQPLDMLQLFTGALTANQIVIVPNLSKFWLMDNQTTGSFQLLMQTPSGAFINIPQGTTKFVACDGNGNLLRLDKDQVGNLEYNALVSPGTLQASGQSLLKTDFPDLYAKYGATFGSVDSLHFTLPLLTDTGRFLRSTTGSLTVGTYQANANASHTHTASGSTGNESAAHSHTGSGTTGTMNSNTSHSHSGTVPIQGTTGSPLVSAAAWGRNDTGVDFLPATIAATNTDHTHSYSFTTGTESAVHTHAFSVTTSTGSADSTESRPESLAVTISIRY
jgi:hypothetical protein